VIKPPPWGGSATPRPLVTMGVAGERATTFFFCVIDMWWTVNIWTKNITDVPNEFLLLTQVQLIKQMKIHILNLKSIIKVFNYFFLFNYLAL